MSGCCTAATGSLLVGLLLAGGGVLPGVSSPRPASGVHVVQEPLYAAPPYTSARRLLPDTLTVLPDSLIGTRDACPPLVDQDMVMVPPDSVAAQIRWVRPSRRVDPGIFANPCPFSLLRPEREDEQRP